MAQHPTRAWSFSCGRFFLLCITRIKCITCRMNCEKKTPPCLRFYTLRCGQRARRGFGFRSRENRLVTHSWLRLRVCRSGVASEFSIRTRKYAESMFSSCHIAFRPIMNLLFTGKAKFIYLEAYETKKILNLIKGS